MSDKRFLKILNAIGMAAVCFGAVSAVVLYVAWLVFLLAIFVLLLVSAP